MKNKLKSIFLCSVLLLGFSACEDASDQQIEAPVLESQIPGNIYDASKSDELGDKIDSPDYEVDPGSNGIGRPHPIVVNPKNKKGTLHRLTVHE